MFGSFQPTIMLIRLVIVQIIVIELFYYIHLLLHLLHFYHSHYAIQKVESPMIFLDLFELYK